MKKTFKNKKNEKWLGIGFITPALIIIGVFVFISIMYALYLSFHRVNLFNNQLTFVGLDNYRMLFQDTRFKIALGNTIRFAMIVVPSQTIIALVLASVLNAKIRGKFSFRIIYFLPTLTSSAALTMIFMFLFSLTGPVNQVMKMVGLLSQNVNFLNDPRVALSVIMVMNIWSTVPYFMTIYFAGLQEVPNTLYESAEIDGANAFQKFWYVTIPMLKPVTTFVLLMGIVGTFQMFDQAFIFSSGTGGPENSTLTVALLVYRYAFGQNNTMGYAAAIAIILTVIIFTVSTIAKKLNKSESVY